MQTKYLIFDFDGVLADTLDVCAHVRVALGIAKDYAEGISIGEQYFNNPVDHAKNHTMTIEQMQARTDWLTSRGEHQVRLGFDLFHEFCATIATLQNVKIAIVSSNARASILCKVDQLGFMPTHILGFEDHHSKESKIEHICTDRNVSVSDIYYFTDTKADVYELRDMISPDKLIGCAWGFCGYDALCEVMLSQYVMQEFDDIYRMIGREQKYVQKKKIAYIDHINIKMGTDEMGWELDWKRLYIYLMDHYRFDEIGIYIGYVYSQKLYYDYLRGLGYMLYFKSTYIKPNGDIKGNVDTLLVHKATLHVQEYQPSFCMLLSGDGDFDVIVKYWIEQGIDYIWGVSNKNKIGKLVMETAKNNILILSHIQEHIQKTIYNPKIIYGREATVGH